MPLIKCTTFDRASFISYCLSCKNQNYIKLANIHQLFNHKENGEMKQRLNLKRNDLHSVCLRSVELNSDPIGTSQCTFLLYFKYQNFIP